MSILVDTGLIKRGRPGRSYEFNLEGHSVTCPGDLEFSVLYKDGLYYPGGRCGCGRIKEFSETGYEHHADAYEWRSKYVGVASDGEV